MAEAAFSLTAQAPEKLPAFDAWRLEQRDAVEFLGSLPTESISLTVTDPAYESLEKHRAVGTTTRLKKSKSSSNEWFPIFPNARYPEFFRELYRVMARNTHTYVFADCETSYIIKPIAEAAGFKFWKNLIWDRSRLGMGYHYRARHEYILFLEKGKRRIRDLSIPDVLRVPRDKSCTYPTEKPATLVDILVSQSYEPGGVICDPFMGSGVVGTSALWYGCRFIGCDVSDAAHARTRARLEALPSGPPAPAWPLPHEPYAPFEDGIELGDAEAMAEDEAE